jgi:integrase
VDRPKLARQRPRLCHPETGRPLDRSKLVRRFKQATDRADVRTMTSHELRHTFGTRMAANGIPLRTIQHWMGHADAKTTQIYAHYAPSGQEADAVDEAFA